MGSKTGIAAILALVAAVGSYLLSFSGHPIWALFAAIISVPLGAVGLVMAASPRVSGGIMSIIAMVLGVGGVILAVLVLVGMILF
jgi:hypothetical protein